jgi:hypothetical protein
MGPVDGERRGNAPTLDRNGDIMRQQQTISALLGAAILIISLASAPRATLAAGASKRPATPNACSLLTAADLTAVFHSPLHGAPHGGASGPFSTCTFVVKARTVPLLVTDEAAIRARTPYKTLAAYWNTTANTRVVEVHSRVKGVGDAAMFLPSLGQFWVRKGTYMFAISSAPTRLGTLAQLENLARRVMKRL